MKRTVLILFFILIASTLSAQDVGFMGITIGMSRKEVLHYADTNKLIVVPKNRDVELFPVEKRKILTLSVNPEIPHIYLQFYNDTLYAITVIFNNKYIGYQLLCQKLQEKYGKYTQLAPQWRKWENNDIIIKVEKPAVVKYIALSTFLTVTNFKKSSLPSDAERRDILLKGL